LVLSLNLFGHLDFLANLTNFYIVANRKIDDSLVYIDVIGKSHQNTTGIYNHFYQVWPQIFVAINPLVKARNYKKANRYVHLKFDLLKHVA
jgi:hypothetical protein